MRKGSGKRRKGDPLMDASLMTVAALAAGAGVPRVEVMKAPKLPDYQFTQEELQKLEEFDQTREGIKAKKKFVRELQAKYRERNSIEQMNQVLDSQVQAETSQESVNA